MSGPSLNNTTVRQHFETFDAFRFFAFFKVFLLHMPIMAFPWFNFMKAGGGIGVQFFFVLSGFLITYISCFEKKQTGQLNLKNFFVRRILRIWPLYYLMVFIAYSTPYLLKHFLDLSSSSEGYEPQFWISALFLENYKMMITHQHANVSPLSVMWSLCIEEHFYVIWGVMLFYIQIKNLPKVIATCVVIGIIARFLYYRVHIPSIDLVSNIDLFALGALPAYLFVEKKAKLLDFVSNISIVVKLFFCFFLVVVVLIYSQAESDKWFILGTTILGLLFSILLLFALPGKNQLRIKDRNLLSKMGIYTYGLYLYHTLIINLLRQVFTKVKINTNEVIEAIAFFLLALLFTFLCSILSYHLFEKHFLKLKRYFR